MELPSIKPIAEVRFGELIDIGDGGIAIAYGALPFPTPRGEILLDLVELGVMEFAFARHTIAAGFVVSYGTDWVFRAGGFAPIARAPNRQSCGGVFLTNTGKLMMPVRSNPDDPEAGVSWIDWKVQNARIPSVFSEAMWWSIGFVESNGDYAEVYRQDRSALAEKAAT